jgi:prepilin-type N-terminal cleavage/methylation domain-containing protein
MKKLRAFTIIELSITLLISGVVVSIAYYAYSLFINQYKTQQTKSDLIREYFLFQKAMQIDVDRSEFIRDSASYLFFEKSSSDLVIYDFADSFIVRKSAVSADTFHVRKKTSQFLHYSNNVNLVSRIHVLFDLRKDYLEADFLKTYSCRELMINTAKNE